MQRSTAQFIATRYTSLLHERCLQCDSTALVSMWRVWVHERVRIQEPVIAILRRCYR